MSKTKNALGKGLSALIYEGDAELQNMSETATISNQPIPISGSLHALLIPVKDLVPGRFQPRGYFDEDKLNELTKSIKENGVIQPILVRSEDTSGRYEIIAGERRWRACKQAGLETIPAVIKELTDKDALEAALIENIQRQSLTPIEEADGYKKLQQEFGYTQEQLASNLGKSRSHITNMLRLLQLPNEVKDLINTGALSMGHARALINSDTPVEVAYKIIENGLSVRDAEKFAGGSGQLGGGTKSSAKPRKKTVQNNSTQTEGEKDEDLIALQSALSSNIGLKVSIDYSDEGGRVSLFFNNMSDLDKILQKLD